MLRTVAANCCDIITAVLEEAGAGQLSVQSCCSMIASTSAAAPHLRLLQLLLPALTSASAAACRLRHFSPDCVHFNCSPIASASTAAPRLHPSCSGRFQPNAGPMFLNILRGVRGSVVQRSRVTSLVPPHFRHTHTH